MNIARMSMSMSQVSFSSAVQLSLMKIQMNTSNELANGMNDMLKDMAIEPGKGANLDTRA